MKSKKDKQRVRVSPEAMRESAASSGRSGGVPFTLPPGVTPWVPEKAKTYALDFIPYEVTDANHPDSTARLVLEPGSLWWKRPFQIHRDIGPSGVVVICPTSTGKPCPICEYRKKLTADWDKNVAEIKSLNWQKWVVYSIQDPNDADKGTIYATSAGKFARNKGVGIDCEIEELPDEKVMFWEVQNGLGHTVNVRFSDAEFSGEDGRAAKYLTATKFEFKKRDDMDEEEVLGKAVNLDNLFSGVMEYNKLKALFLQVEDDEENPSATASGSGSGKSGGKKKSKPAAEEPPDEDDEEEPDADEDNDDEKETAAKAPKFKEGDHATGIDSDDKKCAGKIIDIDGDTITIEDDEDEEHDCDISTVKAAKDKAGKKDKKEPAEEPEGEDEDEDEDDDDEPDADEEDPDDDDDDKPADEDEPDYAIGDRVTDGTVTGECLKIDSKKEEVTVKDEATGGKTILAMDEVKKAPAKEKTMTLTAGDKVMIEDDDEGEIIKVHTDGTRAKVKVGDEEPKWFPVDTLTKKKAKKK